MSKKTNKIIRKRKRNKSNTYRLLFLILLLLLALSFMFVFLTKSPFNFETADKNSKPAKTIETKFTIEGKLFFLNKNERDTIKTISIEIADTDYHRQRGLMYRYSMPCNVGMLFIFDREEPQSFWMKNTYISLDIIFLNKDLEIVTIQKHTKPLTEWPIPSYKPAKYIIEVNAGFCDEYKIETGGKVKYKRL